MKRLFLLSFSLLFLASCSLFQTSSTTQGATYGGLGGAAVGAGTGALVGTMLTAGDVGASALLGAGIGLPVGAAVGYYYVKNKNEAELRENQRLIDLNHSTIVQRERELTELRERAELDSFTTEIDSSLQDDLYLGPSLGNYLR